MQRHHFASLHKGVLIDANLLIVLIVGMLGPGEVEKFKKTTAYTSEDVIGIDALIREFGWIGTTPHVIAEVSNLLDWIDQRKRQTAKTLLAELTGNLREIYFASTEIVATPVYFKLGITDAGLFMAASQQRFVLLTADLPLYHYASGLNVEAINFNHLREHWLNG